MKINLEKLLQQYNETGRDSFHKFVEECKNGKVKKIPNPFFSKVTIEQLQSIDYKFNDILSSSVSDIEIHNLIWQILDNLRELDSETIKQYAIYYAIRHDIPIDDNCESLLSSDGRKILEDNQFTIADIRRKVKQMGLDNFNSAELIYFINQLCFNKS